MLRRAFSTLVILFISHCAFAAEVRIAVPQTYLEDTFLKLLLASKELADIGIQPAQLPTWSEQEAKDAVKSGAADLVVFDPDRRALDQSGSEAGALLAQPFMFKSAAEVIRMQKSFLKEAAVTCASRSGLFPFGIVESQHHLFPHQRPHSHGRRFQQSEDGGGREPVDAEWADHRL